jgi:hypothetical protein
MKSKSDNLFCKLIRGPVAPFLYMPPRPAVYVTGGRTFSLSLVHYCRSVEPSEWIGFALSDLARSAGESNSSSLPGFRPEPLAALSDTIPGRVALCLSKGKAQINNRLVLLNP